jgi:hypothetical protein
MLVQTVVGELDKRTGVKNARTARLDQESMQASSAPRAVKGGMPSPLAGF